MNNNLPTIVDTQHEEQDHPLVRAAYALGVGLILLGSVMPHGERWTMTGIALMAATFLY
jgi:hypothetical protein